MKAGKSHNSIFMEKRKTNLSFAVKLIDDFTETQPTGRLRVYIKEIMKIENGKKEFVQGILNPGGYYLFLDLPRKDYTPHNMQHFIIPGYRYSIPWYRDR